MALNPIKKKSTKKVYDCGVCGLSNNRLTNHGKIDEAEILIIADIPDQLDFKYGKILSGRTGRLLNNSLINAKVDLKKIYTTSIMLCELPPRSKEPKLEQIKSCGVNILKTIDDMPNLKLIITLGKWPLKFFLNKSDPKKVRGELFKKDNLNIFPMQDPSYIIDNPSERGLFEKDFAKAKLIVEGKSSNKDIKYTMCNSIADVKEAQKKLNAAKMWAFDIESRGGEYGLDLYSDHNFITTVAFTTDNKENICIPVDHPGSTIEDRNLLITILRDIFSQDNKKIAHNAAFDVKGMKLLLGIETTNLYACTALMSSLVNQGDGSSNSLKRLSIDLLGYPSDYSIISGNTQLDKEPLKKVAKYNCEDTENTLEIYDILLGQLKTIKLDNLFFDVVMKGRGALNDIELNGAKIDIEYGEKLAKEYEEKRKEKLVELESHIPKVKKLEMFLDGREFNLKSNDHLAYLLFDLFGLPVQKKTASGKRSVDAETLKNLKGSHLFVDSLLEYKLYEKCISTYITPLMNKHLKKDGKIHCNYRQDSTVSGRLSSSNPNLQNIPSRGTIGKHVKSLFVPSYKDAYLLQADYSQIELRVAAIMANEPTMLDIYSKAGDIHAMTAAATLGIPIEQVTDADRQAAKAINFGFIYGMSAKGFMFYAKQSYDVVYTLAEADQIRNNYFSTYSKLPIWYDKTLRFARQHGHVENLFGRRRKLINIAAQNSYTRGKAERQAINSPVQSTAADICLLAIYNINNFLKKKNMKSRIVNTVHDSIILEVPENELMDAAKIVKTMMERVPLPFEKTIPLTSDLEYGRSWGSLKNLTI